ncbi:CvpA family protein [Zavarzinella formosa]|uniref:CvpA family protein n=1 Tax=Zavarzinella formosa TaxID=360055 RepID=UPI0002D569D3|nr:CvpA family protein [Zavarzinella formosa]
MLAVMTLFVMGFVVFSMMREGLFSALCYLFGVVFAGLISFHFWPPLANALEDSFQGSFLANYEDAVALYVIFAIVLLLCRVTSNAIAGRELDIPPQMSQIGGGIIGAVTGYLVAGFLVCALQTLPWEEKFLGYQPPPTEPTAGRGYGFISKKVIPPDQMWLKLMRHASLKIFEDEDLSYAKSAEPFDVFTYQFSKYRRLQPDGKPLEIPLPPAPPLPPKKDPMIDGKKDPPVEDKKVPAVDGMPDPAIEEKKDPPENKKEDPM